MPYRQRVYRVSADADGGYESEIYEVTDPLRFAGAWREDEPLGGLTPDSLIMREGCAVFLRRDEAGVFAGGTDGASCASTLRGAATASSEVRITAESLESRDRGFDAQGRQVWGAEAGPYIFLRKAASD